MCNVCQGSASSPLLFIIVIDMREKYTKGYAVGDVAC